MSVSTDSVKFRRVQLARRRVSVSASVDNKNKTADGRRRVDEGARSGSLAVHTINWFNTHKLQRLIVQRPLLIEAGSAYISHGDLLML